MSAFAQIPPEVIAQLAKDNKSPQIIALVAAFTALGFVCVVLRFFARIKLVGIVGLEDYFIAISMVGISTSFGECDARSWTHARVLGLLDSDVGVLDSRREVR
jgi:hypothetical protein